MIGFSLIELLVAGSLSALLLGALTVTLQLYSDHISVVQAKSGDPLEDGVATVADAVRHAWSIQQLSGTEIQLTDPLGGVTSYAMANGDLVVSRDGGETGVLVEGLASGSFSVETQRRLREDTPVDARGAVWSEPVGNNPGGFAALPGQQLALAFTVSSEAPDDLEPLDDVEERLINTTLDLLSIPIAVIDGSLPEFCHLHAAGPPHDWSHGSGGSVLEVELYEALTSGDARPYGPLLGSTQIAVSGLPPASYGWRDWSDGTWVTPPEVSLPAAGPDWAWWAANPDVRVAPFAPAASASLDLSAISTVLEPGRAYTLLIRVVGNDLLAIEGAYKPTALLSGVAFRASVNDVFIPIRIGIPRSVKGLRTFSQTQSIDEVSQVLVRLEASSGASASASAAVTSQVAVPNPWRGVVQGELPALELVDS